MKLHYERFILILFLKYECILSQNNNSKCKLGIIIKHENNNKIKIIKNKIVRNNDNKLNNK